MSVFGELQRRNVLRVGFAYAVTAWLIAQVADLTADAFAAPDWVMRMLLVILVLGFPLALFFAWIYELTPQGLRRESDIKPEESVTAHTGQRLTRATIALLSLAVVVLLGDKFFLRDAPGSGNPAEQAELDRSVAVLPFRDLSPDGDSGWFAEGLTAELIGALTKAPDLRVASRSASFRFEDSDLPPGEIAGALGVAHILEGSIRRGGDDIRVTAQLIRASDGFPVWSENFDGSAEDAIAIQEQIARAIARALATALDPAALEAMLSAGTTSVDAYEAYLRGREAGQFDQQDGKSQALTFARRAVELDPGFAAAHQLIGELWLDDLRVSSFGSEALGGPVAERQEAFSTAIRRAIETAASDVERLRYEAFLAEGELRLRDALAKYAAYTTALPNDAEALSDYAQVASIAREHELATRIIDRIVDLAPNEVWSINRAVNGYFRALRPDKGAALARRLLELAPTQDQTLYQAQRALLWNGETEAAGELLPRYLASQGDNRSTGYFVARIRQACAENRREDALRIREEAIASNAPPNWFFHIAAVLEPPRIASEVLRPIATSGNAYGLANYLTYPHFDPRPFPELMQVLLRESVTIGEPANLPFACPPAESGAPKRVAVLPFAALSSGEDDGYFADGLTEEILNALAHLPQLLVTARTSAFAFKNSDLDIPAIADALGVEHVVEGSVRRSGDRARITAKLIRAADGFQLWSETYDRTLADSFTVQEEIAEKVVQALDIVLDERQRRIMTQAGTRDVEAFVAYQKGFELYEDAHRSAPQVPTLQRANAWFEQAIDRSPFSAAYLLHSDVYTHVLMDEALERAEHDIGLASSEAILDALLADVDRAIELAETPGMRANARNMRVLFTDDWRGLPGTVADTVNASDCLAPMWVHILLPLSDVGQARRIAGVFERLTRCDPLREMGWLYASLSRLWAGDLDRARALLDEGDSRLAEGPRLVEVGRLLAAATGNRALLEEIAGVDPEAKTLLMAFDAEVPDAFGDITPLELAAIGGDRDGANRIASAMDAHPTGPAALLVATTYCACGAPFDLEATPNFAARLDEAGLSWPPRTIVRYPAKDW